MAIRETELNGFTKADEKLLDDFGLKKCLMSGLPDWLKKWTCLICRYIGFEEMIYPEVFQPEFP